MLLLGEARRDRRRRPVGSKSSRTAKAAATSQVFEPAHSYSSTRFWVVIERLPLDPSSLAPAGSLHRRWRRVGLLDRHERRQPLAPLGSVRVIDPPEADALSGAWILSKVGSVALSLHSTSLQRADFQTCG